MREQAARRRQRLQDWRMLQKGADRHLSDTEQVVWSIVEIGTQRRGSGLVERDVEQHCAPSRLNHVSAQPRKPRSHHGVHREEHSLQSVFRQIEQRWSCDISATGGCERRTMVIDGERHAAVERCCGERPGRRWCVVERRDERRRATRRTKGRSGDREPEIAVSRRNPITRS